MRRSISSSKAWRLEPRNEARRSGFDHQGAQRLDEGESLLDVGTGLRQAAGRGFHPGQGGQRLRLAAAVRDRPA